MIHLLLLAFFQTQATSSHSIHLKDVGLKLTFPSQWELNTEGATPFAAMAQLPPQRAIAMISRERENPLDPVDMSRRKLVQTLEHSFSEHQILKEEILKTNSGLEIKVLAIQGKARNLTLRHLTCLFSGFGERFSITFATRDEYYEELASSFLEIAKTLELSGPKKEDLAFVNAAEAKDPDFRLLKKLLAQGASINALNRKGHSSLTMAVVDRKGPLVKWLLENGADLEHPTNNFSFLSMVASPPILELMERRLGKYTEERKAVKVTPEWVTPEAAVFYGIHNNRVEFVKQGIEMGADLKTLEDNYKLPPLAFTRQLMREYQELGLDGSKLKPIEAVLVQAEKGVN